MTDRASPPSHAREGLSLADAPGLTSPLSFVRRTTPPEPPRHVKHIQMNLLEPQTVAKHATSSLPAPQTIVKPTDRTSQSQLPRYILQIQFKSSSDQLDPHMKFRPSSNQLVPTSCQLRVVQYARTISHDSPAPHSYHPTMGRRQRRQAINPPRRRRLGVLNPGSTSLRRASAKLNGRAAALADPSAYHRLLVDFLLMRSAVRR